MFTIGLDKKDLDLLVQIKAFFKLGNICTSNRGIVYYTVGSVKDIEKHAKGKTICYNKIYFTSF